jgi:drug/metabolite transporter (DMT)-like permease
MRARSAIQNISEFTHLDIGTLAAFAILVVIGGSNPVAVRFSNLELPPFWGAATRFGAAALVFWIITFIRRIPLPTGRSLIGAVLLGIFSVGLSYAFLYWGLLQVQANLSMVVLALVPLFTFIFAIVHNLERFRWQGLIGAIIALIGILFGIGGGVGYSIPIPSLLALVAGAVCLAEGSVIYKQLVESHPVSTNTVSVTTGTVLLFIISLAAGEVWVFPETIATWSAFIYLVLPGTVLLFYLYLVVLTRWTASATTYSFLLFPVATVFIAAWLADEVITLPFVIGSIIVLTGVYLGAVKRRITTRV